MAYSNPKIVTGMEFGIFNSPSFLLNFQRKFIKILKIHAFFIRIDSIRIPG